MNNKLMFTISASRSPPMSNDQMAVVEMTRLALWKMYNNNSGPNSPTPDQLGRLAPQPPVSLPSIPHEIFGKHMNSEKDEDKENREDEEEEEEIEPAASGEERNAKNAGDENNGSLTPPPAKRPLLSGSNGGVDNEDEENRGVMMSADNNLADVNRKRSHNGSRKDMSADAIMPGANIKITNRGIYK